MQNNINYTIGFFIPNLVGEYHKNQWIPIYKKALEKHINLIIFSPFMFYSHYHYRNDFLKTFNLADTCNIDGLIVSTGSLNVFYKKKEIIELCNNFKDIPIISIAESLKDCPSVLIDNKEGMHQLVEHFILDHKFKKIAFIKGPDNNQEANLRFIAYTDVLKKHNMKIDKKLIVQGNFGISSGKDAIVELFDKRKTKFDAIIAANDEMILGALKELNSRKIRVPDDIAIGGFDNTDAVKESIPPITSVKQPIIEQAEKAFELIIDLINNKPIKKKHVLKAYPKIRESCGCKKYEYIEQKKNINNKNYNLEEKPKNLETIEAGYNMGYLTVFSTSIMNALNFQEIQDQLEKLLLSLQINSFFIALYNEGIPLENDKHIIPPEYSDVFFIYKNKKIIKINKNNKKIKTKNLIPDIYLNTNKQKSYICTELNFNKNHYGYMIIELSIIDPFIIHLLKLQLINSIQYIFIHKELEKAFEKQKELDHTKTNFFTNISHEFRTPLTLILSPIENIINGLYGQSINRDDSIFKTIQNNCYRLYKLINNILDLSKIEAGKMTLHKQYTDIVKLINFFTTSIYSGVESRGLKINFKAPNDKIYTLIDRDLIEKAFFNLISNAMKFSPKGSLISIKIKEINNEIKLSVKDRGIGIKKEKLNMIFDRFSQVDDGISRKHEGTGIGLSFTNEIIKLHNGKIEVKSEFGKGTEFIISLPTKDISENEIDYNDNKIEDINKINKYLFSNIQVKQEKNNIIDESKNKKHTILVVDDNQDMRKFINSILIKKYKVITAKNGKEGIKAAKKIKPSLILSDVMMPIMSGYEFCNEIKKDPSLKNTPFILVTAKSDISMKIEGLEHGADDYLSKPFNAQELLLRINVFISREELRRNLQNKNKILKKISQIDGPTNLLNHKAVHEKYRLIFKESRGNNYPLTIIMMDIDNFKYFNDNYGHQFGDSIIKEVAKVIIKSLRGNDIKGRYGGDEFILILPYCAEKEIELLYHRLFEGVKSITFDDYPEVKITASYGIAILKKDVKCNDCNKLINLADKALYKAKSLGRDHGYILKYI